MPRYAALIVAAGHGARFGSARPKVYADLAGRPVLARAMAPFLTDTAITTVQAVIRAADSGDYAAVAKACGHPAKLRPPVIGGATRARSVRLGLQALASLPDGPPDVVLIHDGARPQVTAEVIGRVVSALDDATLHGAVPALPITDTIKRAVGAGGGGQDAAASRIGATVPRDGLWRAQTPQGFRFAALVEAYDRLDTQEAGGHEATDDAAVAEAAGLAVRLVAGEPDNIKITVADDLIRVRQSLAAGGDSRIGQGLDVHRFGPAVEGGTRIWLCGVALPHDRPLIGHSDADAGLHALTDAVLGAIGAGDIGQHFPPTDGRWRGASSDQFLAYAAGLVRQGGGTIINLDVTLVCESPRIAPHRVVMADRIAAIAGVAASRVSVKATTTEGLGFAGRGEGVLAQAVAMIRWPI